jgi:heme A synthase
MGTKPIDGFLGGPWQKVLLRLVIFSVIVGFVMATFGLDPDVLVRNLVESAHRIVNAIAFQGLDTVLTLGRYCLYGAVIVIPIWLISRLFASRGR